MQTGSGTLNKRNELICITLLPPQQNHQTFEVTTAKEINKRKICLDFYAFEHLIGRNQPEFLMVRSGEISPKEESTCDQFQRAV